MKEAEAVAAAQQGHRNYAKRQMTWFRREPDVHWMDAFGDQPETVARADALIREALSSGPKQPEA
jgi:tRNA dimethylallyltransferase